MFFSIYLAFAIVSAAVLHGVFVPFVHLAQIINIRLGRPTGNPTGGYAAFFTLVIVLTVLLVGLFGLLGRISHMGQPLRYVALITTLAAAPVCWFYVARWHGWFSFRGHGVQCLGLAGGVCTLEDPLWSVCFGVLCPLRILGAPILAVHTQSAEILLPFVGFCASIAWISSQSSFRTASEPARSETR